jgi:catalase
MHRQAIPRGRVAYEPNSLAGGCPFQAGARGFMSFPEPVAEDKVRGKPEKFAEHYLQATLFYNSQTPVEQAHIAAAFRFELSKVTVPAIRERMLSSLVNVSKDLAGAVAAGLGMSLPAPMPSALPKPVLPEVKVSSSLSQMAHPGDGGIRSRKVAVLIADGVDGDRVIATQARLLAEGAVPRLVGLRIGPVRAAKGEMLEAEASMEGEPGCLFDGLVLPDGDGSASALAAAGQTMEFIKDQYRHCKTILVFGAARLLIEQADIPLALPGGSADPGLLLANGSDTEAGLSRFIDALALHRHWQRETDPPLI